MEVLNGGDQTNGLLTSGNSIHHLLPNGVVPPASKILGVPVNNRLKEKGVSIADGDQVSLENGNSDGFRIKDVNLHMDGNDCGELGTKSSCSPNEDVKDRDAETIDNRDSRTGEHGIDSPANGEIGDDDVGDDQTAGSRRNSEVQAPIQPNSQLPKPEAPRGITTTDCMPDSPKFDRSKSLPESINAVDMPAIGKFFRDKSSSLSAAITKRFSSLTEFSDDDYPGKKSSSVTEFNISGLKVIVKLKKQDDEKVAMELKGRITFFSRSNCRDCGAVRAFLRERKLRYCEINVDVFPTREKELMDRTGSKAVPQIFFNEKLFGGLVALNSLRNSGLLEERLKDMLSRKCPDDAPSPPVYGFDDQEEEEEETDEMVAAVRVLRQRLPIQDRLMKMKIVKNCFTGAEMVEVLIHYFDCGRKKAIEIGKQLARKHFIHHVFGENEFEDGKHHYRFLEHEPFIPKAFNFRESTNDIEPKAATFVSLRLQKIMSAILESYASEDQSHLDYIGISNSEEFRRYLNLAQDLQRVNIAELTKEEKLAFFLNLYNAMVIHAVIRIGHPGAAMIDRRSFYSDFLYVVGGRAYSLSSIKNGILRSNRRAPYSLVKPFGNGDRRLELSFTSVNPLIHFGLCNGTQSSPRVRFFTPQGIESELRVAAREFFHKDGIDVDLAKRTVHLARLFNWFNSDFGQEKEEILKWIINYLDATKAGLLTHLLGDSGPVHIVYRDYDWSVNC